MSRVLTFSTQYPGYHPKEGQPTYFVEKIWMGLPSVIDDQYFLKVEEEFRKIHNSLHPIDYKHLRNSIMNSQERQPAKGHTIRAGKHWKAGDKFSPRIWSGKPYYSKQLIIAPDIEVKKVWDFEIVNLSIYLNGFPISPDKLCDVAQNDGLDYFDFLDWFKYGKKDFSGQIICWNDRIEY